MKGKPFKTIVLFALLFAIIAIFSGCTQANTPDAILSTNSDTFVEDEKNSAIIHNTYIPPPDENGYITITIPITLMGGNTAEEVIAQFQNTEQYNHEGEVPPNQRLTDVVANEDGTVNYIFTQEQFEEYKETTYNTGRFKYGFGSFPSIQGAEYTQIDDSGIPWGVVVTVDQDEYDSNQPWSSFYATVWPAIYLGQYQIFSGIGEDDWSVHVVVKDFESGRILTESDFPSREE